MLHVRLRARYILFNFKELEFHTYRKHFKEILRAVSVVRIYQHPFFEHRLYSYKIYALSYCQWGWEEDR